MQRNLATDHSLKLELRAEFSLNLCKIVRMIDVSHNSAIAYQDVFNLVTVRAK
jgi:hypothetical protein